MLLTYDACEDDGNDIDDDDHVDPASFTTMTVTVRNQLCHFFFVFILKDVGAINNSTAVWQNKISCQCYIAKYKTRREFLTLFSIYFNC